MRNIRRVVLWGLPPSFCALVQRAGRAARDFHTLGEAILFVSANIVKEGLKIADAERIVNEVAQVAEAENRDGEEDTPMDLETEVAPVGEPSSSGQVLNAEGARVEVGGEQDSEPENEPKVTTKKSKRTENQANTTEVHFLSLYASGKTCRRKVWNEFFRNGQKSMSHCT